MTKTKSYLGTVDEVDQMQYIEYFKKIEDLLDVAKTIDITDILTALSFGFEETVQFPVNIRKFGQKFLNFGNFKVDGVEKLDLFKRLWTPSLHFERGICYTFDNIAITLNHSGSDIIATMSKDEMSKSVHKGSLLEVGLEFDVSFEASNTLSKFNTFTTAKVQSIITTSLLSLVQIVFQYCH